MHQWNKADILVHIDMIIGGRIAEEIVFGKENVSAGASSDLRRATHHAERMIKELGFSDSVSITRIFHCIVVTACENLPPCVCKAGADCIV